MNTSGRIRLNVETYLAGKNQPTHPSIVSFNQEWNGFRYWMAYSPYPYGNGEEENPCIAVSNDLLYWTTPDNFVNPIAFNEETGCPELKDPHILYRGDLNRLEIWYLGRRCKAAGGDGRTLEIFRKCSTDGIHWSRYEVLTDTDFLSPSVIWENGKYKLWEIGYTKKTKGVFQYRESTDGVHWFNATKCVYMKDNLCSEWEIWHGSVNKINNKYHLAYIDKIKGSDVIFHAVSDDGIMFKNFCPLIELSSEWDYFYRPFLLHDGIKYICVYGVVNRDNSWYLSANYGSELENMRGVDAIDIKGMIVLSDSVTKTNTAVFGLKNHIKKVNNFMRVELWVFFLPILLLDLLCGVTLLFKCALATILIIAFLTRLRFYEESFVYQLISACIQGITIAVVSSFVTQALR